MNPTTKQIEALRNFKVSEERIQGLSIEQASEMLAQLVKRAREGRKSAPPNKDEATLSQASANLGEAARIVMDYFGLEDKSQLNEAHIALIQETSRQVYGLKYWIEKSNKRID